MTPLCRTEPLYFMNPNTPNGDYSNTKDILKMSEYIMLFGTCDRKTDSELQGTESLFWGSGTVNLCCVSAWGRHFLFTSFQPAYPGALLTLFISLMKGAGELSAFHLTCSALVMPCANTQISL